MRSRYPPSNIDQSVMHYQIQYTGVSILYTGVSILLVCSHVHRFLVLVSGDMHKSAVSFCPMR